MNLESGFLILYDWLPALQTLSGEDYKALVEALIARQRSGKALPSFANPMVQVFADMMEPTIVRRLKGSECAKRQKGACGTPTSPLEAIPEATLEATLEATPQPRKEKQSKDKHSKAELSGAEHSGASAPTPTCTLQAVAPQGAPQSAPQGAPQSAPQSAPQGAPQEAPQETRERRLETLLEQGIPKEYLDTRIERATIHARAIGREVEEVLLEWWRADRMRAPWYTRFATHQASPTADMSTSSFDTDDFFQAALNYSQRTIAAALAEDHPPPGA